MLLALLLVGCKKDDKAAAPPPVAQAIKLPILLDDKVLTESPSLGVTPTALSALATGAPPIGEWIAVEVLDQAGKVDTLLAPAKNYPGAEPALTADAKGVWFGLLQGGKLTQPVGPIARLTIKTKSDAGKPAPHIDHGSGSGGGDHGATARATPTDALEIEIETAAGTSTFTGDKMVGLPELTAPTGDTETPGWNLVDVLAAAGIKDAKAVVLTDEEQATLRVEGDDWDPARTVLYFKLNKSGQLRFRVFRKTGDVWEMAGELRGVKKLRVP
jgi:hypothetical protein